MKQTVHPEILESIKYITSIIEDRLWDKLYDRRGENYYQCADWNCRVRKSTDENIKTVHSKECGIGIHLKRIKAFIEIEDMLENENQENGYL